MPHRQQPRPRTSDVGAAPVVARIVGLATAILLIAVGVALAIGPSHSGAGTGAACALGRMTRPSHDSLFRVTIVGGTDPIIVGNPNVWILAIATADGLPVTQAEVTVASWMPDEGEHARGRPTVRAAAWPGAYRVEGLRFDRAGWWNVKLTVRSPIGSDSLAFNALVDTGRCAGPGSST